MDFAGLAAAPRGLCDEAPPVWRDMQPGGVKSGRTGALPASVVLHAIWNIKARLLGHGGVANPRHSGTMAVASSSLRPCPDPKSIAFICSIKHATPHWRVKVQPDANATFTLRNLTEILQAQEESVRTMTLLLAE